MSRPIEVPGAAIRLGVVLPTFTADLDEPLRAARECEDVGIHGVFSYNHLWPIGRPGEPALSAFPLLGAVAAATETITVGTLVARVSLGSPEALLATLRTLALFAEGRFIAGLGTGDAKSAAENVAFGIPEHSASYRRERLSEVGAALRGEGIETWIGGGAAATNAVARRIGAVLNLWGAARSHLAEAAVEGPVTWGGSLPEDRARAAERLEQVRAAGASWAVFTWPGSCAPLVELAERTGVELG